MIKRSPNYIQKLKREKNIHSKIIFIKIFKHKIKAGCNKVWCLLLHSKFNPHLLFYILQFAK